MISQVPAPIEETKYMKTRKQQAKQIQKIDPCTENWLHPISFIDLLVQIPISVLVL